MLDQVEGLVNCVIGANKKVGAGTRKFFRRRHHQTGQSGPVAGFNTLHVVGERVRMQRNFRMSVPSHQFGAFEADGAVAQRRSFRAASDDTDVLGHEQLYFRWRRGVPTLCARAGQARASMTASYFTQPSFSRA